MGAVMSVRAQGKYPHQECRRRRGRGEGQHGPLGGGPDGVVEERSTQHCVGSAFQPACGPSSLPAGPPPGVHPCASPPPPPPDRPSRFRPGIPVPQPERARSLLPPSRLGGKGGGPPGSPSSQMYSSNCRRECRLESSGPGQLRLRPVRSTPMARLRLGSKERFTVASSRLGSGGEQEGGHPRCPADPLVAVLRCAGRTHHPAQPWASSQLRPPPPSPGRCRTPRRNGLPPQRHPWPLPECSTPPGFPISVGHRIPLTWSCGPTPPHGNRAPVPEQRLKQPRTCGESRRFHVLPGSLVHDPVVALSISITRAFCSASKKASPVPCHVLSGQEEGVQDGEDPRLPHPSQPPRYGPPRP